MTVPSSLAKESSAGSSFRFNIAICLVLVVAICLAIFAAMYSRSMMMESANTESPSTISSKHYDASMTSVVEASVPRRLKPRKREFF